MAGGSAASSAKSAGAGWDAQTYHRVAQPQAEWGRELIARAEWRPADRVIDAGCGSGSLDLDILARIPQGRLVAFDFDPAMVAKAREVLAGPIAEGRAEVMQADALEFQPGEPADVVFSNATFHWILDHDRLWRRCFEWLRPGGRLYVQCGGAGNLAPQVELVKKIARADADLATFAERLDRPSYYATAEETAARLAAAGFADIDTRLESREARFDSPADFEAFARTVFLRPYRSVLPPDLWERLVPVFVERAVADRGPVYDYVRLTATARRPA